MKRALGGMLRVGVAVLALGGARPASGQAKDAGDYFGTGPQRDLAEAAAAGRLPQIKQALAAGAKIDAQGQDGMTVLIWAMANENKRGVQALLKAGANPNLQTVDGDSAMGYAAMNDDAGYLDALLKSGGNPNLVNPNTSETVIFESIRRSLLKQVQLLIAAHADLNCRDRNGATPVLAAASAGQCKLVHAMLAAGADPTVKDDAGHTVLYYVMRNEAEPGSDESGWRTKVIALLQAKGVTAGGD